MNIRIEHTTHLFAIALCASLGCAQQDGAAPPAAHRKSPGFAAIDQLIRTPVVVAPKAKAVDAAGTKSGHGESGDAKQGEKEKSDGKTGKVAEAVRADLGTLRDLVLDTDKMEITFAVIDTVDGGRAVPLGKLVWDTGTRRWLVGDAAFVRDGKPCDGVDLGRLHMTTTAAEGESGEAAPKPPLRYVLASTYAMRDVEARNGRIGAGLSLVLETNSLTPAFLRIATDRGDLAVPCACVERGKGAANPAEALRLRHDKATVDKAPLLGKEPKATLDDAAFRAELYRAFDVPVPTWESTSGRDG